MFKESDRIVTAFAQRVSGPGWSNALIWVVVENSGSFRMEAIQPDEQTSDMHLLFDVNASAHDVMTDAVARWSKKERFGIDR